MNRVSRWMDIQLTAKDVHGVDRTLPKLRCFMTLDLDDLNAELEMRIPAGEVERFKRECGVIIEQRDGKIETRTFDEPDNRTEGGNG